MSAVRIAVAGRGLIGKRHIEEVDASGSTELASIVDPGPAGPELARKYDVPLYLSLTELFERDRPDGVILATPNRMHGDGLKTLRVTEAVVQAARTGQVVDTRL